MAVSLEPHAVHRSVNHRLTEDVLDLLGQSRLLPEIDHFTTEGLRLRQTLGNHVAYDDHGGAQ